MDKIEPGKSKAPGRGMRARQRERLEVVQDLMGAADRVSYRQREAAAAERLELSISSRLVAF